MVAASGQLSPSSTTSSSTSLGAAEDRRFHGRAQFIDRIDAASQLATNLQRYKRDHNVIILSISQGGAVIGNILSEKLCVPHIFYMIRPIPWRLLPRLSLGSVAGDGSVRVDNQIASSVGAVMNGGDSTPLMEIVREVDREIQAEQRLFHLPIPEREMISGRTIIVVDDGIEAGDIMREAILHLTHCYDSVKVVVAVPVCFADLKKVLAKDTESVVDVVSPVFTGSVSSWYRMGTRPSEDELKVLEGIFDFSVTPCRFDAA